MLQIPTRRFLSILGSAALLLASAVTAHAHFCTEACGSGGMQCSRMAVQLSKGCRLGCKATFAADPAGRHACVDDCHTQVMTDRAACVLDTEDCRAICATAADQTCADEVCSISYNECRAAVLAATRACVKAAGSDGAAIQACIEPGDATMGRAGLAECITNMAGGLSTCIAGC